MKVVTNEEICNFVTTATAIIGEFIQLGIRNLNTVWSIGGNIPVTS